MIKENYFLTRKIAYIHLFAREREISLMTANMSFKFHCELLVMGDKLLCVCADCFIFALSLIRVRDEILANKAIMRNLCFLLHQQARRSSVIESPFNFSLQSSNGLPTLPTTMCCCTLNAIEIMQLKNYQRERERR